jgi:hypothetical protein
MACSDARSKLACALPETAVVALLIRRRVTWALFLFGRGALALHRRELEAPFAPWGYLPAAQLPTQGTTEIRRSSWLQRVRTFRRSGLGAPSLCATQTIKASDAFKISPFRSVFFPVLGYHKPEVDQLAGHWQPPAASESASLQAISAGKPAELHTAPRGGPGVSESAAT